MRTWLTATAALWLGTTAVSAQGPAPAAGPAPGQIAGPAPAQMPLAATVAGIEARGYRILELDRDGARIEIEARRADGRRVDLLVDPATAAILRETPED